VTEFVCEVDERHRSACEDLDFYGEYEGKRYCVFHFPGAEKKADAQFQEALQRKLDEQDFNFSGVYFPDFFSWSTSLGGPRPSQSVSFDGATFAKGVNFTFARFECPVSFMGGTFEDQADLGAHFESTADFRRTTFKGYANFYKAEFIEQLGGHYDPLDYPGTTFSQAEFQAGASFTDVPFEGQADFSKAVFRGGVSFIRTVFHKEAFFSGTSFKEDVSFDEVKFKQLSNFIEITASRKADFREAIFEGPAYFDEATFNKANFSDAYFKEGASFWKLKTSPLSVLGLRATVVEKPERFSFHTTWLRPSWFVDVDAQRFDFSDVEWFSLPNGSQLKLEDEIGALEKRGIETPQSLRKLATACRKLMNNAEENREYPSANEFHYWSMDALRKEGWTRLGLIGTLYWALSGYGVRAARAFWALVVIWAAFATLYVLVDPSEFKDFGQGIGYLWQAAVYSLLALARLNPEPRPEEPGLFQFLVGLEGILAPLQIALLAFAIRRKVMR
jgi:uncharacterized protein YjbI with pentapeptide repeats